MSSATMEAPANVPAVRQNGNIGGAIARQPRQSALAAMASRFAIEPARLLEVMRATIIKGSGGRPATDEEVAAFIVVANQYGLNPLTREIHAFADSQKGVVPIVGIDGWSHLVNAEPRFDGCEFQDEEAPDGKPLKITCVMHVKDRAHPIRVTERFSECKRNTGPWNQMPWRMLRHKAFMQAARLAFSISGLYDEDEARDIIGAQPVMSDPSEPRTASVLRKITSKPVSEHQTFEPDPAAVAQAAQEIESDPSAESPEPNTSGIEQEPPAEVAPVLDTHEQFLSVLQDRAMDLGATESQMHDWLKKVLLREGLVKKEQKATAEQRAAWVEEFEREFARK